MTPIKLYSYLAVALLLAGLFGGYTLHERNVQHTKDVAAAAKIVKKANAIVAADESHAQTTETQSVLIYKQAVSIPAVADIGIVCQRTAPHSVPLPAADTVKSAPVRDDAANRGSGPSYDPTGAALTRAHEADAEIAYLQRRVAELEKQMRDAP